MESLMTGLSMTASGFSTTAALPRRAASASRFFSGGRRFGRFWCFRGLLCASSEAEDHQKSDHTNAKNFFIIFSFPNTRRRTAVSGSTLEHVRRYGILPDCYRSSGHGTNRRPAEYEATDG